MTRWQISVLYLGKITARLSTVSPAGMPPLEAIPFHDQKYVQSPYILSGRMVFENESGEKIEVGPGDTVVFFEDESHRGAVLGEEPVELLCIIDCPGDGADCIPERPERIGCG